MRPFKPFLVFIPLVVALAATSGPSVASGRSAAQFGQQLEGLTLDQRKLFRDGKDAFATVETAADGLGPIFNNTSCGGCHFVPALGGSSPILETRAAHVENGMYTELPGGSLFQSNAISPGCAETIPPSANVIAKRQTTPLFGLGFVEAIPDGQIQSYAAEEARLHPDQAGRVNQVTDVASGATRVGRFGWKAQQATLTAFSGDAYVNEMGITSTLFPTENAPNGDLAKLAACDKVPDPEDHDGDVAAFTNFMRMLAPPPRDEGWTSASWFHTRGQVRVQKHASARINRGEQLFGSVGCAVCHRSGFTAQSPIEAIDGETVDAFSDFLLHDVGTGDGIIQGSAQGNEIKTPPLWGLSASAPYLHDGSAATVRQAIDRHRNQGAAARKAFFDLSGFDQDLLLAFLDSI
jgi:CxxC motif-containing protein (DUF1111 family)